MSCGRSFIKFQFTTYSTFTSSREVIYECDVVNTFFKYVLWYWGRLLTFVLKIQLVERRRANNKDVDEDEEDENGVGVAGANPNSDKNTVRQRK